MVGPIVLNRQGRAVLQGLQRVVHQRLARLRAAPTTAETDLQIARAHDALACIDAALTPGGASKPAESPLRLAQGPLVPPPKVAK